MSRNYVWARTTHNMDDCIVTMPHGIQPPIMMSRNKWDFAKPGTPFQLFETFRTSFQNMPLLWQGREDIWGWSSEGYLSHSTRPDVSGRIVHHNLNALVECTIPHVKFFELPCGPSMHVVPYGGVGQFIWLITVWRTRSDSNFRYECEHRAVFLAISGGIYISISVNGKHFVLGPVKPPCVDRTITTRTITVYDGRRDGVDNYIQIQSDVSWRAKTEERNVSFNMKVRPMEKAFLPNLTIWRNADPVVVNPLNFPDLSVYDQFKPERITSAVDALATDEKLVLKAMCSHLRNRFTTAMNVESYPFWPCWTTPDLRKSRKFDISLAYDTIEFTFRKKDVHHVNMWMQRPRIGYYWHLLTGSQSTPLLEYSAEVSEGIMVSGTHTPPKIPDPIVVLDATLKYKLGFGVLP